MEERVAAQRITRGQTKPLEDSVAIEEPLEIQINGQPWATTMRTPGHDSELALGLLYSEGLIVDYNDVTDIQIDDNIVLIQGDISTEGHTRGFVRSSSCGVCGRASLDAILARQPPAISPNEFRITTDIVDSLVMELRAKQSVFDSTGGVHAVALFNSKGQISDIAEDVGRHNAMDKIVGRSITQLPLSNRGVLLSGRVSFEMVQKAVMAGCPFVAAIGAPTTLAVDLARQHGLTLVGFLREGRFNVYCGANRICPE
ncbi:MAG: formate dehydrogenase accessory sulfurtransferase FdhD [Candidatus Thalassarchaeaceae archaeon]|jgi:FdhD protein|nr:formate dehydrogenase accessory sulfurtransferase FdhD [Candidatus Thalassarchaeaceae archaeon]